MYSRPSAPTIREPWAPRTKTGPPPTARNARTGLFTPPGRERSARASNSWGSLFAISGHRDAGRREAVTHFPHFGGDAVDERAVVSVRNHLAHPIRELLHFQRTHAARRDRRRADTNARGIEGLARVE